MSFFPWARIAPCSPSTTNTPTNTNICLRMAARPSVQRRSPRPRRPTGSPWWSWRASMTSGRPTPRGPQPPHHRHHPMTLSGPAAGHALLKTQADPEGRTALGTFNNCANGQTPWGTYLTCGRTSTATSAVRAKPVLDQRAARYGLAAEDAGFGWHKFDERFDLAKHPQEPHRFGWVVEIDPRDPASTPKKRTALGRFKHENAAFTVNQDGRAVVYLGDDERASTSTASSRRTRWRRATIPTNRDLLDEGTLYVARFEARRGAQGTGQWLPLVHGQHGLTRKNGFADQGRCSSSPGRRRPGSAPPPWTGPARGGRASPQGRGLLHPDQQQEPRHQGEPTSRWRQPQGREPLWPDHPLAPDGDDHGSDSFGGISSCWRATPWRAQGGLMAAVPTSIRTTCSTARTASASTRRGGSGSRPTATTPTRSSLPAWATTRCCAPIPRAARCAAS